MPYHKNKKKEQDGSTAAADGAFPVFEDQNSEFQDDHLDSPEDEDASQGEDPKQSFWSRLLHGVPGKSRTKEVGRSVARGAANLGKEIVEVLGDDHTNTKPIEDWRDKTFGERSDDPLAAFSESVTQFAGGFALTAPLGGIGGAGKLAKFGVATARGAIVDFAAFDPRQEDLAELLARAPEGTPVNDLGKLLTPTADDSELEARAKRAAAGTISGLTLDAIFAGAKRVRAFKRATAPGASAATKEAAAKEIKQAEKVLDAIAEGTHVPEGAHAVAVKTEDGTWEVRAVDEASLRQELGDDAVKSLEPAPDLGTDGIVKGPELPTFADRGEAEAHASVINNAIDERLTAIRQKGGLTSEQAGQVRGWIKKLIEAPDEKELAGLVDGTHFNFSYYTEPDRVLALIESVSKVFKDELDAAQRTGGVTIKRSMRNARRLLDSHGIPEEELAEGMSKSLDKTSITQGWEARRLAGDFIMRELGGKLARMADILENRPHDLISQEEFRLGLGRFYQLQKRLAAVDSGAGRGLNILKFRDSFAEKMRQWNAKAVEEGSRKPKSLKEWQDRTGESLIDALPNEKGIKGKASLERTLKDPKKPVADLGVEKSVEADAPKVDPKVPDGQAPRDVDLNTPAKSDLDVAHSNRELDKSGVADADDDIILQVVAGFTPRELRLQARMLKLAGGDARSVWKVAKSIAVYKETGSMAKAVEYFVNSLLSGFATPITALASGMAVSFFEAGVRIAAGAGLGRGRANPAVFREGVDLLTGHFKYAVDNVKIVKMALKEGRSILNPAPIHYAIDGRHGTVVRMPSRTLSSVDEFVRVSNYRAFVRAKLLREARERGLSGPMLDAHVEEGLQRAFLREEDVVPLATRTAQAHWERMVKKDPTIVPKGAKAEEFIQEAVKRDVAEARKLIGSATLSEPLKFAEVPTFSAPLGTGTLGGDFHNFVANHPEMKFIAPFVKMSTNVFRYAWQATPGLNRLNAQAREILKNGTPEEIAILTARSRIVTTMGAGAFYMVAGGLITGGGPASGPARELWLKDYQPYSVRVGDQWISYRRLEPFATFIGLVSDAYTLYYEGDEASGVDLFSAIMAGLAQNLTSKTYMTGLADFMDAVTSRDGVAFQRYVAKITASLAVPAFVSQFNNSDELRDSRNGGGSMLEEVKAFRNAIVARVPYFNEKLPARYNFAGEPVMGTPKGILNTNRLLNPARAMGPAGEDDVESVLMELEKGFAPAQRFYGKDKSIDLANSKWGLVDGKNAWERFNELLREPKWGGKGVREKLEAYVTSDRWKRLSPGTEAYPGGERWNEAAEIVNDARDRALRYVRKEYPDLDHALKLSEREKRAAMRGGDDAVARVRARLEAARKAAQ